MLSQDEIDEDELNDNLQQLNQSAILGLSNLKKAANLVTRFKRTSADQSSEEARTFNLNEVLQDTLSTLHTIFKKTNIAIELSCPTSINIHSQPGLISQILTNLLMNSHKHGFKNGTQSGTIHIDAQINPISQLLNIQYKDSGAGVLKKHLDNIFEPFFTTARDNEGSGLGLTICYNIITIQLRGEISCHSEPDQGILFNIAIPTTAAKMK